MKSNELRIVRRERRRKGIRKLVHGTSERPRLCVFRSHRHIYAQIVDDDRGVTLCEASTQSKELRGRISKGGDIAAAKIVGATLAARATAKSIKAVCFDRNGYRYHGRLKGLADAAREGGLSF